MHRTRSWALRLVTRLRVEVGVSASLDAAMNNVSPSAPNRRSDQSLAQGLQRLQEKKSDLQSCFDPRSCETGENIPHGLRVATVIDKVPIALIDGQPHEWTKYRWPLFCWVGVVTTWRAGCRRDRGRRQDMHCVIPGHRPTVTTAKIHVSRRPIQSHDRGARDQDDRHVVKFR
jgi:hypothetical protein